MLTPDRAKVAYRETDVTSPVGILGTNDAYDLTLYHDAAGGGKGVLVCHVDIQLIFKDHNHQYWTHAEKVAFAQSYAKEVPLAWSEKFRITTTSKLPAITDVGVLFEVTLITEGINISEHWEVTVKKVTGNVTSSVNQFTGYSSHDSMDFDEKWKGSLGNAPGCSGGPSVCAIKQRAAIHEFGHMLGLRDEYQEANDNPNWLGDIDSVMHHGESIRPRHYAIFADWLNDQYATLGKLGKEKIEWKVGGSVDMNNAKL